MSELDEILDAWAARQRLTEARAAAMRAFITGQQPAATPTPRWWQEFTTRMTTTIVQATTRPLQFGSWAA